MELFRFSLSLALVLQLFLLTRSNVPGSNIYDQEESEERRQLAGRISISEHNPASTAAHHIRLNLLLERINVTLDSVVDANLEQLATAFHHGNLCPFKKKVIDKMNYGETVKILIVGGSVTYGAELKDRLKQRWSNSFTEIMNSGWYSGKFDIVNLGVGACNIDVWIYKVKQLQSADLVIVDTSVNDQGFDLQALPYYYETFIQLVDNLPNHPAIFFNQAFRGAKRDMRDIDSHCPTDYIKCCQGEMFCHRWWEMQDFVSIALKKYHIPFVSYRDLVWPDYNHPPDTLSQFWNGMSHPDEKAHALLAKLFAYGMMMQLKESHHYDINNHCSDSREKSRYVAKDSKKSQFSSSLCSEYATQMMATDEIGSKGNFHLDNNLQDDKYHRWSFFNDSQLKFGWILQTNKTDITSTCGSDVLPEKIFLPSSPDSFICSKAIEEHTLSIPLDFHDSNNPKIQLIFLISYAEEMGDVILWLDDVKAESVVITGKWNQEYSVSHVATISKEEILNVSSYIRGDSYRMKSLSPGKHTLHISVGHFTHAEKFKWKLLGISSC
eukprot:gene1846-1978_t